MKKERLLILLLSIALLAAPQMPMTAYAEGTEPPGTITETPETEPSGQEGTETPGTETPGQGGTETPGGEQQPPADTPPEGGDRKTRLRKYICFLPKYTDIRTERAKAPESLPRICRSL